MDGNADTGPFSPANFEDAYESCPIAVAFDIGGNGSSSPYGTAVNAIITKHMDEIRSKTVTTPSQPVSWKKRFRDFISKKNGDLLDFLAVEIPTHPVMGPAEILLRRFGNPQVHSGHPSVKDMVIDASGADHLVGINAGLDAARGTETGLKAHALATGHIYDEYRSAGEAIMKQQSMLKIKLDKLDRIQTRLTALFDIDAGNDAHTPLMEASEAYFKTVYDENHIGTEYAALIEAYKKFIALRDVVQMMRVSAIEHEPICSVCLNEAVSYTLTPCGHTFCQSCVRRQGGNCPMCRTNIKERVRIYFG